jgi:FKBP-type peptidyl-prolyl cis-trans isomerase FklB
VTKPIHYIAVLALLGSAIVLPAAMAADKKYTTEKERFSYALGVQLGRSLQQQGITDVDSKALAQAIDDMVTGKQPRVSSQDMQAAMNAYREKIVAEQQAKGNAASMAGEKFRSANKKRKGVTELANGIQYEVIKKGKGKKPTINDTVTVHYHGTLISGNVFDSSVKRGQPATFPLNGVIKGWQEILPLMPTGSKWKVVIPPNLAYGERGAGSSIGPNETLIFEIELLAIK